jgi:hypothetical protein
MKSICTLFFCFLCIAISPAISQVNFKASEGVSAVTKSAQGTLGLSALAVFLAKDSFIPSKFTDSDVMMKNINANSTYKIFAAANPSSKPLFVPFGYNSLATLFPRNTLVWTLNFPATQGTNSLLCEVNGITGEAKCQIITSVEEESNATSASSFISPNPAQQEATLTLSNEFFSPNVSIELFNSIGKFLNRFQLSINISDKITIPLDDLANEVYFIRYSTNKGSITKPIVV